MEILEYFEQLTVPMTQADIDQIAYLMDDNLREQVHLEMAPCEPIAFLRRYCELDPGFGTITDW